MRLVGRPPLPDMGASYARLCMAYAVAKVLQNGTLDLADFRGAALADPATHALAARVTPATTATPIPTRSRRSAWSCGSRTARRIVACETMLAHPARPLTREQHLAKFRRCLDFAATPLAPDAAERLIETVDRLETMGDVRGLAP